MKCGRCQREIKKDESDSILTFTNFLSRKTTTTDLCERCSMGFIEWFSNGNYIQKTNKRRRGKGKTKNERKKGY